MQPTKVTETEDINLQVQLQANTRQKTISKQLATVSLVTMTTTVLTYSITDHKLIVIHTIKDNLQVTMTANSQH